MKKITGGEVIGFVLGLVVAANACLGVQNCTSDAWADDNQQRRQTDALESIANTLKDRCKP